MIFPRCVAAVVATALLLAGCAPATPDAATPTATPTPTVSVTPEVVVATSAILSLDSLSIRDQNGSELQSAPFADPARMLALLTEVLGPAPEKRDPGKGGVTYVWPTATYNDFVSSLTLLAADLGGLPISTSQGIHVGSPRADVAALSPFDASPDQSGARLGLEPREVPGTVSLSIPGTTGTEFIVVQFEGDTVVSLRAPWGDFYDL